MLKTYHGRGVPRNTDFPPNRMRRVAATSTFALKEADFTVGRLQLSFGHSRAQENRRCLIRAITLRAGLAQCGKTRHEADTHLENERRYRETPGSVRDWGAMLGVAVPEGRIW